MVAGGALLRPAAVQGGVPEVDLVPTKVRQLTDPQGVTVSHKDHGERRGGPAVLAGRLDQLLDFGLGQILAGRSSAFGRRLGVTVRFTVVGAISFSV